MIQAICNICGTNSSKCQRYGGGLALCPACLVSEAETPTPKVATR